MKREVERLPRSGFLPPLRERRLPPSLPGTIVPRCLLTWRRLGWPAYRLSLATRPFPAARFYPLWSFFCGRAEERKGTGHVGSSEVNLTLFAFL